MKGVILAAGSGTELRPLTENTSKPMLRILGKPLLEYAVLRLKANGITDIIIVSRLEHIELREYFSNGKTFGVSINYCNQLEDKSGIEGALLSVKKYIGEEQFILLHADTISHHSIIARTLNAAEAVGTDTSIAITLQSDIRNYGVVSLKSDGSVGKVMADENGNRSHYVIAGTFLLNTRIFKYLEKGISFNHCFNAMNDDNVKISAGIWNESWFDIGRPWDILNASKYLLEKLEDTVISSGAYIENNVDIKGPVIIESGVEILNGTIIKGPVYIAKGVFIGNNTLIRNNCEIGENVKIGFQTEIRSSIIMNNVSIAGQSYIGSSIIGAFATIHPAVITINKNIPFQPIVTSIGDKNYQEVVVPLEKFGAVIGPKSHVGVRTTLMPGVRIDAGVLIGPNTTVSGHIR